MKAGERGFLLLTSHLGDPERKILTVAQLRQLHLRVRRAGAESGLRELEEADLLALGYDRAFASRILRLLGQEEQLDWYIRQGTKKDCVPVTRVSEAYPDRLRRKLALDCPGSLWAKGSLELLEKPAVAVVGSREPGTLGMAFAEEAGAQIARQGYVLVSGNARGVDRIAQESCLACGGQVISVVADELEARPAEPNILYLSEDGFDCPFSPMRALSRNRIIHSMGKLTLVVQSRLGKGGTWDGTVKNLKHGWTPVFCLDDGTEASVMLEQLGAELISGSALTDLSKLTSGVRSFFETD